MPFGPFSNKFSPKKPGPRKASSLSTLKDLDRETLQRELSADDAGHKIRMNLDGNKIFFDGNDWVSGMLEIIPIHNCVPESCSFV